MTSERMIQLAELVLRVSNIPNVCTSITIGDPTDRRIYLNDLRGGKSNTTVYCADGLIPKYPGEIRYIEDLQFDAAEAHLRQILEGVTE